ncbi:trans-aconitate 3-methyltransferase isoform X1 [Megalops cyprinoides]|uniref:trans-aconitate 3-methyltransferase isoform X1 n=1 Tax=Megalops cyprinoides TaxID=118141 RepID=UPI001864677C|nr:trans-aconitate 3-methyltransferase isoform X1 [Megalops cyprinoides]XP_036400538.1 trans-aconitate 3-methyltransferase isoform X1 [Megalops cyprinoides]
MTHRLFEEKHHASLYQKYRFVPPEPLKELILQYLDNKKGQPHVLAVDLGCGTGQNSRLLAPYFQEVVGIDISECQLEQARAVPGFPNVTYRVGSAEELPFEDSSVDLLTAASAAHWFNQERFLKEAVRTLRPRGCMALLGYTDNLGLHYGSCGDRLNCIFEEVKTFLSPYVSTPVAVANTKLQDLFDAIPFPDKERIESIEERKRLSVPGGDGSVIPGHRGGSAVEVFLRAGLQTTVNSVLDSDRDFCLRATPAHSSRGASVVYSWLRRFRSVSPWGPHCRCTG